MTYPSIQLDVGLVERIYEVTHADPGLSTEVVDFRFLRRHPTFVAIPGHIGLLKVQEFSWKGLQQCYFPIKDPQPFLKRKSANGYTKILSLGVVVAIRAVVVATTITTGTTNSITKLWIWTAIRIYIDNSMHTNSQLRSNAMR